MKLAVLFIFTCAFFTTVWTIDDGEIIEGLAQAFEITIEQAAKCVNKMQTTAESFDLLRKVLNNRMDEPVDPSGVRKATCALTCCAQIQGTMVGSKMQMNKVHELIDKEDHMPEEMRLKFHLRANRCNDNVKDISDECDVGLEFVKCMIKKS